MNLAQLSYLVSKVSLLIPFLAGLFGIIVGAYLSRRADRLRQLEVVRSSAYADFLRGVAGLAARDPTYMRRPEQIDEYTRYRVLVAEAKARIAICGSRRVVASLAEFLRAGSQINSPEQERLFVALCSDMRADYVSSKEPVPYEEISCLLFDPKHPA